MKTKEEELQAEIKQLKADREALKLTMKLYLNGMIDSIMACLTDINTSDKS